jgi:hypothetical protein
MLVQQPQKNPDSSSPSKAKRQTNKKHRPSTPFLVALVAVGSLTAAIYTIRKSIVLSFAWYQIW